MARWGCGRLVAFVSMALALFLLVLAGACGEDYGAEEPTKTTSPDSAAPDASIVDPCTHIFESPPPETDDDRETETNYWLATERVILPMSDTTAGVHPGLDLDHSCTCQRDLFDGAPVCETPTAQGIRTACDFEGGVDDSLGKIAQEYSSNGADLDLGDPVNRQIREGRRTLLMYLSKYNGKANDTDVGVAFVGSGGLYTNVGCDGQPRDAMVFAGPDAGLPGTQYGPIWDGCDRWTPLPGLAYGTWPNRATPVTRAYVNNFTLVVPIKEVVLDIFGTSVRAGNGFAIMRLSPEGKGFRGEGFISARMAFQDLVTMIGRVPLKSGGETTTPLCETAFWPVVGPRLCAARDTMASPPQDRRIGEICNAGTATIGIIGRPASVADGEFQSPIKEPSCNTQIVCPETAGK